MQNRLVQLFARYIGLALVSIAVWLLPDVTEDQKAQIADFATTIAAAAVGFFGLLVDLFIHRMNNGAIMAAPKNAGRVSPVNAAKTALLALMLLPATILVAGCTNSGQVAREGLLSPWAVNSGWPEIKPYAEAGIAAKVESGELTDLTARSPRETIRLFDEAVSQLGGVVVHPEPSRFTGPT